ncbi:MAG: cytochrome c [Rhodospirillales bacterium]|jgi:mono/diheme cytochrome c family protein|nr:cytochrome c [Rhodospirillales bacterium]
MPKWFYCTAAALSILWSGHAEAQVDPDTWASIVRGGRLYDKWFEETREPAPEKRHPAYPEAGPQANDAAATWRCKECHGWDYKGRDGVYGSGSHFTGIKGIRGMAETPIGTITAILKDRNHQYGDLMAATDLADIATFVSLGQVEMDLSIEQGTGVVKGDKTARVAEFQTICANCHGHDGLKVRDMPPLGQAVRDNPWEALHNILNGHPNEKMPALRVLGIPVLVDILAYAQALPSNNVLASVVRGGRLYDNWINAIGGPPPQTRHRAYPSGATFAREPKTNWRCKECHGWDYKGKDGAYGTGKHKTGISGIREFDRADPDRIAAVLKDNNHRYARWLDILDFQDLANFVTRGQVDMDDFIDRGTAKAKGDPQKRAAYFHTICAGCHGTDGRKVATSPPLGRTAQNNPWEALHKILNGHPDEKMPALRSLAPQVLADILAYVQTLPAED